MISKIETSCQLFPTRGVVLAGLEVLVKFVNLPAGNAQIIACDCVGTGEQDCVFSSALFPLTAPSRSNSTLSPPG